MVPPCFAETDQTAYYRRIAGLYRQAVSGVNRLVLLSSYGAHLDRDTGFILGAHHAEVILGELRGVSLTRLRAGYFYYNLDNFAGVIRHAGRIVSNYGGGDLLPLVAPADIASAAAEELVKPAGEAVRYVVSDPLTASETAAVLGAAIGIPGMVWDAVPDAEALKGMTDNGLPEYLAREFVALGSALHRGALTARLGPAPRSLDRGLPSAPAFGPGQGQTERFRRRIRPPLRRRIRVGTGLRADPAPRVPCRR
jgi:uncharacterized protein YbjT (DUF2867 family)